MRTVRPLCAQPQDPAQRSHGETVSSALAQAVVQACFVQDGFGISSKLAEHARDNGREAQVEEPALGWTRGRLRCLAENNPHGNGSVVRITFAEPDRERLII